MTAKRITPGSHDPGEDLSEAFEDEGPSGASEQVEKVENAETSSAKASRRMRLLLAINLTVLILVLAGVAYALASAAAPKGGPAPTLASVAAPVATEMEWVRSIYAWGTRDDEHLITPNTVAIGPDGVIWANSRNRYAVAFNPDASFDRILMSRSSNATPTVSKGSTGAAPRPDRRPPSRTA
jgi:hypothetical protein